MREKARARLPTTWSALSDADIFETVVSIATALSAGFASTERVVFLGRDDLNLVSPEALARAGRMVLDGHKGIADLLVEIRSENADRGMQRGVFAELGQLSSLKSNRYLSKEVVDIFDKAIGDELAVRPASMTMDWNRRLNDGRVDLRSISRETGLHMRRLMRLIEAGHVPCVQGGHRNNTVRVFAEDMGAALRGLSDAVSAKETAATLRVSEGCLGLLVDQGHIAQVSPLLGLVLGPVEHFSRGCITKLIEALAQSVSPVTQSNGLPLDSFLGSTARHSGRWGAALVCLIAGHGKPVRLIGGGPWDWRHAAIIEDVDDFDLAMEQVPMANELIDASAVANVLGTSEDLVESLARAGVLVRSKNKPTHFGRRAVQEFAKHYVFGPEIAKAMALRHGRVVRRKLACLGVHPTVTLPDKKRLLYRRDEVDLALVRLTDTTQ